MTNDTAQEPRWEKRGPNAITGTWIVWSVLEFQQGVIDGHVQRIVAYCDHETDADAILADHERAARVGPLVEALEQIATRRAADGHWIPGYLEMTRIARAALDADKEG